MAISNLKSVKTYVNRKGGKRKKSVYSLQNQQVSVQNPTMSYSGEVNQDMKDEIRCVKIV